MVVSQIDLTRRPRARFTDDGRRALDPTLRGVLRITAPRCSGCCAASSAATGRTTPSRRRSYAPFAAYDRLDHGEHLRAWVLTIATRVAIDTHRRAKPTEEPPELPHEDPRPAYEDLGELTDGLPPKERAAVVLRYGYDLTYEQIAAALDSSPVAARQAASTGVRRLRKEVTR